MNKDEMKMIEDIKKILIRAYGRTRTNSEDYICRKQATALYNANCRIIADNEMVFNAYQLHDVFKKHEQEVARKILQRFYNRAKSNKNDFADVNSYEIELMAEEFGIELE